eukprot:1371779-Rhodomonas_salina.2
MPLRHVRYYSVRGMSAIVLRLHYATFGTDLGVCRYQAMGREASNSIIDALRKQVVAARLAS